MLACHNLHGIDMLADYACVVPAAHLRSTGRASVQPMQVHMHVLQLPLVRRALKHRTTWQTAHVRLVRKARAPRFAVWYAQGLESPNQIEDIRPQTSL